LTCVAGFAPTKAAQRILAEAMARDPGPQGVHVAYVIVDKVIDLESTRKRFQDRPDEFFIKPRAIAGENLACGSAGSQRVVIQRRATTLRGIW